MRILFVLFALHLLFCSKHEDSIDDLLEKKSEVIKMTSTCSCGKSMDVLLSAKSDSLRTPKDILHTFGKWDTTYSEIAVLACSSFVYNCGNKFVSFHYARGTMKFVGRSYGDLTDGRYINSGDLIELDK
jgi:hypothetical protein